MSDAGGTAFLSTVDIPYLGSGHCLISVATQYPGPQPLGAWPLQPPIILTQLNILFLQVTRVLKVTHYLLQTMPSSGF